MLFWHALEEAFGTTARKRAGLDRPSQCDEMCCGCPIDPPGPGPEVGEYNGDSGKLLLSKVS